MLEMLWGLKTLAAFDVWTIEHILSGLSVGGLAGSFVKKNLSKVRPTLNMFHSSIIKYEIIFVLFMAYLWETLEHYLETGLAGGVVAHWFQGVEFWPNRFITDPLMVVLGYYLVKRFPRLVTPARILSFIWLYVHIFIFPDSMFLHHVF